MSEPKTRPTPSKVGAFLAEVDGAERQADAARLVALMSELSGEPAVMWGPSIIGFGSYHYRYESGREGDSCIVGFSPRKTEFTLYLAGIPSDGGDTGPALLSRLGKHRVGKGCLYLKRLADIDQTVLADLVTSAIAQRRRQHP